MPLPIKAAPGTTAAAIFLGSLPTASNADGTIPIYETIGAGAPIAPLPTCISSRNTGVSGNGFVYHVCSLSHV